MEYHDIGSSVEGHAKTAASTLQAGQGDPQLDEN